jgi:hypothetical protein
MQYIYFIQQKTYLQHCWENFIKKTLKVAPDAKVPSRTYITYISVGLWNQLLKDNESVEQICKKAFKVTEQSQQFTLKLAGITPSPRVKQSIRFSMDWSLKVFSRKFFTISGSPFMRKAKALGTKSLTKTWAKQIKISQMQWTENHCDDTWHVSMHAKWNITIVMCQNVLFHHFRSTFSILLLKRSPNQVLKVSNIRIRLSRSCDTTFLQKCQQKRYDMIVKEMAEKYGKAGKNIHWLLT